MKVANLEGPPISPVTFVGLATKASHAVPTCGYGHTWEAHMNAILSFSIGLLQQY